MNGKLPLFLFLLVSNIYCQNQTQESSVKELQENEKIRKSRFLIYPGCENQDDLYECYSDKLQDFLSQNLRNKTKSFIVENSVSDTIVFLANIKYNKIGKVDFEESKITAFIKEVNGSIDSLKYILPSVVPAMNSEGHPIENSVAYTVGFIINRDKILLQPIYGYQPKLTLKQHDFLKTKSETPPVYPNCEIYKDQAQLRKCFSENLTKLILDNFDSKKIKESRLKSGIYNITASFKIETDGSISNHKVHAPTKLLEMETLRILRRIPTITPAEVNGNKVITPYSLPITFQVK
ncbi:energy transducer TonB [Sediminibacter sp. Hel_I_10]|uniref:energy transducer TonB n=1 Tax=Sediminibacter sp. Hel_I_10 TaxID=1392490 RepID=UPI00047D13F1|nr:energy transducer TonB [Sediminibacter sp. Hel_I_10]